VSSAFFFQIRPNKEIILKIRVDPCVRFSWKDFEQKIGSLFFSKKEGKLKQGLFSILNTIQRLGFKDYKNKDFVEIFLPASDGRVRYVFRGGI